MEIGIVGKPNVGKSTFFAAATLANAQIASYPFTTIEPNMGVAYVRTKCPHVELNVQCNPRNSLCMDGIRLVPVKMIDVAGLVPDAHKGRGLGNKFLDDLRQADCLIHIVDASGSTTAEGNLCNPGEHDPLEDVAFLEREIHYWLAGILMKDWERRARGIEISGGKLEDMLAEKLAGLGMTHKHILAALHAAPVDPSKPSKWKEEEFLAFSKILIKISKPVIIAANKADIAPEENLKKLLSLKDYIVVPTMADYELALRRAAKSGIIRYTPGDIDFEIQKPESLNEAQKKGLEKIREGLKKFGGTGVQKCIETAVFKLLERIVVYPVEDENHFRDKEGRVLPDAFLLPKESTARDLAYKVHTDLGKNFIRAINARTKMVLGADYQLRDGDIIKIVAKG
ncbi:MAG: redox-regulated ATPase YchF [Thermoplasmata archaeon]